VPLLSIWNGAKVLLSGAGLTPKMSAEQELAVGENQVLRKARFLPEAWTVEFGIGASDPSDVEWCSRRRWGRPSRIDRRGIAFTC